MATKTVLFKVEVKNMEITSFDYSIKAVGSYQGGVANGESIKGNTFSAQIREDQAEYFAVTVQLLSYSIGGVSYTIQGKPVSLLATFSIASFDDVVAICPESSIASIYTFAQMTTVGNDGWIHMDGTVRNMKIAYGMKQQFYKTEGNVADMIRQSPNGFETNSYPMFNSLCNLFYYSLTNPTASTGKPFYDQFLDYAWHEKNQLNHNFLQAVRNMLYDPFTHANDIYQMLAGVEEVYKESLTTMNVSDIEKAPDNWTLTLKSNSSGSKNFIPSGLAFVVFDKDDNAWVANNFRAGSNLSGTHCPVYKYDATPAAFSPVQGGGLLGVAFGAAINPDKTQISFGNFGWGPELNNPQEGSISRFNYSDGTPISSSNGYTLGLSRVQGMEYDKSGNLWMASVGCQEPFAPAPIGAYPFKSEPSAVVVYLNGDPTEENVIVLDEFPVKQSSSSKAIPLKTPYLKIFDVTPDNNGNAYVSCIGNYDEDIDKCALSAVYKVSLSGKKLSVIASWYSDYPSDINKQTGFESLRQVAINGDGDVVVVGVASSRATVLNGSDLSFKEYYDTNTNAPWGVKIDKKQTVFLANFGHDTGSIKKGTFDLEGPFGVTMLRDTSNPKTAKLLTVPTGGSEVTLANGYPLYGIQTRPGKPIILIQGEPTFTQHRMKCYQPIMRLTSTNIDGAGNLWCMNNWKPSVLVDVADNPGGDGVVIFLGIAAPE